MTAHASVWIDILVAALIVTGSLFALAAALGVALLKDGFQRLHPPALASAGGAWCMSAAALAHFSALEHAPALYMWLIPILLVITTPVSALLIARVALFRHRQANIPDVPPPLQIQPSDDPAG